MGTVYSRTIPNDLDPADYERTVEHVRETITSIVSPNDDPHEGGVQVEISVDRVDENNTKITGRSNLDPVADYLRDDFDPDRDAYVDNPLHPDVPPLHLIGNEPGVKE